MIYTHQHPDLDAIASVWFCLRFITEQPVAFRPANWDGAGSAAGDWILDMDCGLKGERDADGRVHACFAALVARYATPEDRLALTPLVRYIDLQDSRGGALQAFGVTEGEAFDVLTAGDLTTLFRALQSEAGDDEAFLQRCLPLFDALMAEARGRQQAQREADEAQWVGRVAIQRNARQFATMDALFARGALAVVYQKGCNLGVVRAHGVTARMDDVRLRALVAGEAGWFFHPAGFMACRGSDKAPVATPSAIAAERVAEVVDAVLQM